MAAQARWAAVVRAEDEAGGDAEATTLVRGELAEDKRRLADAAQQRDWLRRALAVLSGLVIVLALSHASGIAESAGHPRVRHPARQSAQPPGVALIPGAAEDDNDDWEATGDADVSAEDSAYDGFDPISNSGADAQAEPDAVTPRDEPAPEATEELRIKTVDDRPPGAGVDLARLNRCLEKHVRAFQWGEKGLDELYPDVPLMSSHWSNFDDFFYGGSFGTATTWTMSTSKHLAYLILPKVGSMTFRTQLALCDKGKGIPCDVINTKGRPFRAEDALMKFNAKSGFSRSYITRTSEAKSADASSGEYSIRVQDKAYFASELENDLPFTFVQDPITKFVGGFIQVHHFLGVNNDKHDENYRAEFLAYAKKYTDFDRPHGRGNSHFAPQMYYMITSAIERTLIAQEFWNKDTKFDAPLEFIGRLDANAPKDWEALVHLLATKYPEAAKYVNSTLVKSNGGKLLSKADLARIKREAAKNNWYTADRDARWQNMHFHAKKALGDLAHAKTWPRDLTRRFCAALYVEYLCLGFPFPPECLNDKGEYDVSEYPRHIQPAP